MPEKNNMKIQIRLKDDQILETLDFAVEVTWVAIKDYEVKDVVLVSEEGTVHKRVTIDRLVKEGQSFIIEFPEYKGLN